MLLESMKRVNVVGTSGSGKSTFSQQLASKLEYPYIELDALYWKPYWGESSDKELFEKLEQALSQDTWILDGNYNRTVPIKWSNVDVVIWIDYSFSRTLYQAIKRAIIRITARENLWGKQGTKETIAKTFLSKDSIILWTLKTYKSNRERYTKMFNLPEYRHINFIRLSSPKEAQSYLNSLQ